MPTTFMGRDNNNNPCYHVRKTNGLSADAMKSGVQDDTLFHSSLPYLQVVHSESVGITKTIYTTHTLSGFTGITNVFPVFNIPVNIQNYLSNMHVIIPVCTWDNGTKSILSINTEIGIYRARIGADKEGQQYSYYSSITGIQHAYCANGWFTRDEMLSDNPLGNSQFTSGDVTSTATNTLENTEKSFLSSTSKYLIFHGVGSSYNRIDPSSNSPRWGELFLCSIKPVTVKFLVLNVRNLATGMVFDGVPTSGDDVKISKNGLFIGGSDVLAGKTFLNVTASDLSFGEYKYVPSATAFAGAPKATQAIHDNGGVAFCTINKVSADNIPSDTAYNSWTGTTPFIISTGSSGNLFSSYYKIINRKPATSGIESTSTTSDIYISGNKHYYKSDIFDTVTIPSNVSSCIFARDSLSVNGTPIFDANSPFIYPSLTVPINVEAPQCYIASGSLHGTPVELSVISTTPIAVPSAKLHVLLTAGTFTDNSFYNVDYGFMDTETNINSGAKLSPNLGGRLVTLSEGQLVNIQAIQYALVQTSGDTGHMSSTVIYCLRRVGNNIEFIRIVKESKYNTNTSSNYITRIPGYKLSYMQLASAF